MFIKLRKFFTHCLLIAELIKLRKFFTHCQLKEEFIKLKQVSQIKRELKEICPQADGGIAIAVQTGKEEVEYVEYHGRKAVREYRIPFEISGDVPNAETVEAIQEVKRMKADPSLGKTYSNVDQMMEELLADV